MLASHAELRGKLSDKRRQAIQQRAREAYNNYGGLHTQTTVPQNYCFGEGKPLPAAQRLMDQVGLNAPEKGPTLRMFGTAPSVVKRPAPVNGIFYSGKQLENFLASQEMVRRGQQMQGH
jgi:hypothetical protein